MSCFLHRKPQKNCTKCQQAIAALKASVVEEPRDSAVGSDDKGAATSKTQVDSTSDRKLFLSRCSPMLKEQIVKSTYFKRLVATTAVDSIIEEIHKSVTGIEVFCPGATKISCSVSSNNSPTCFICHVAHLEDVLAANFENELTLLVDNREHAVVRCVGLLYLRFVTPVEDLLSVFEEYLLDDMELSYDKGGGVITTTIGEYVESLLMQDKYFDSPLPRLPVKVKTLVEDKVAPMLQYRKRTAANRNSLTRDNIKDMPVEVCIDGQWTKAVARGFASRHSSCMHVRVQLGDNTDANVHLGKVIIDDGAAGGGDGDSRKNGRSRSRSRGRGRGHNRGASPDWSRYKGKSDHNLLQELRERVRSQAASGQSISHGSRNVMPQPPDVRVGRRGRGYAEEREDDEALEDARRGERRRQEDEQERQRKLASVYQKYCAAAPRSSGSAYKDVDTMDTLKFG